jgi:hypothetical protein
VKVKDKDDFIKIHEPPLIEEIENVNSHSIPNCWRSGIYVEKSTIQAQIYSSNTYS